MIYFGRILGKGNSDEWLLIDSHLDAIGVPYQTRYLLRNGKHFMKAWRISESNLHLLPSNNNGPYLYVTKTDDNEDEGHSIYKMREDPFDFSDSPKTEWS